MGDGSGRFERVILAMVICALLAGTYLLVDEWLFSPAGSPTATRPQGPPAAAAAPANSEPRSVSQAGPKPARAQRPPSLRSIAKLLPRAPEKLQLGLVRGLARLPVTRSGDALAAFLLRTGELHPGAVLEATAQLKRGGKAGAERLVALYPKVDAQRRAVIIQAFEAYKSPEDQQALAQLALDPADPLKERWQSIKSGAARKDLVR